MSQKRNFQVSSSTANGVTNSDAELTSTPHKRRRQTNQALEALGQLMKESSFNDSDNKLNKNDILSLTLARLLRQKYWPSNISNKNIHLASGISSSSIMDDLSGFIIVFNTSGRIIFMSDNVEYYLRKNVQSLYPQLTSIYNCVSKDDHERIRQMLSTPSDNEQRIICTWHLPRGKRPSRNHTETKPILMTGRFVTINDEETKEQNEPLFVARCEQILSNIPNIPTNSIGAVSTTTLRFVLTDQLSIREISSNTESLLGYKAHDLIDLSINQLLATEHIQTLEKARQHCIVGQHYTIMNVLDLFTRNGDRLTFLCNTHMLVEGRRKAIKLGFLAQLIDPSAKYDFVLYAEKQNLERLKTTVQQEFTLSLNNNSNNLTATNILSSKYEPCLNLSSVSSICPKSILPQRRKRRRTHQPYIKSEPLNFVPEVEQAPQQLNDSNESHLSSSESITSPASPMQEIDCIDDLFPSIDDMLEMEKLKVFQDFPTLEDIHDLFSAQNDLQLCLSTPIIPSANFAF